MVGIVQEQHPERTRLFMQWQQMDWPVMVDPLNLLGLPVVPVTLLIDEHGVVRGQGEKKNLEAFLETEVLAPAVLPMAQISPPALADLEKEAISPRGWRRYADAVVLWGEPPELDDAISAYQRVIEARPDDGPAHFRLGVAHRRRYDSPGRRDGDFQRAVDHWGAALDLDPNQYIWRRRIQQYGPRLGQPYPFYDWVDDARREISARGETPLPLPIEPRGAEIAHPVKSFAAEKGSRTSPDPDGRILRDEKGFVRIEQTLVPSRLAANATGRIHIVFRPDPEIGAHWNNEAGDLALWIDPPAGWRVDRRTLSVPNPSELISEEPRRLEIEVQTPASFGGSAVLPAYALYYVCEDVQDTCLYRRQDIALRVGAAAPP